MPTSVVRGSRPIGATTRLHTRMVVREDAMMLYGFSAVDERELFDLLTGVTGVGPKVALAFLSALRPAVLTPRDRAGDAAALTVVPGVGKKVAQRVVLDLRREAGRRGRARVGGSAGRRARCAPVARAHARRRPARRMRGIEADGREAEDILREALQKVGR